MDGIMISVWCSFMWNFIVLMDFLRHVLSLSLSFYLSPSLSLTLYLSVPLHGQNVLDEKAMQFQSNLLVVCLVFLIFFWFHFICDHPVRAFAWHRFLWFWGMLLWQRNRQQSLVFHTTVMKIQWKCLIRFIHKRRAIEFNLLTQYPNSISWWTFTNDHNVQNKCDANVKHCTSFFSPSISDAVGA